MSFTKIVKQEICKCDITSLNQKLARIYGLLLFGKEFTRRQIIKKIEDFKLAKQYVNWIYDVTDLNQGCNLKNTTKSKYLLRIMNDKLLFKLFDLFDSVLKYDEQKYNWFVNDNEHLRIFFIQGMFLSCGSIYNPAKEYRLEFLINNNILAHHSYYILKKTFKNVHIYKKANSKVIYIKESETLEKVLIHIGSFRACFDLMNAKIYKELRNKVNRLTNCDTANIDKTILAAKEQIDAINKLETIGHLNDLTYRTKLVANVRMENPQASNNDLATMTKENLTRSMVSYHLKKIIIYAKRF